MEKIPKIKMMNGSIKKVKNKFFLYFYLYPQKYI